MMSAKTWNTLVLAQSLLQLQLQCVWVTAPAMCFMHKLAKWTKGCKLTPLVSVWHKKKWNRWQARKEWFWSTIYWAWALFGRLQAENKKKNKKLDRKTTSGTVAWSLWYTEAGSRVNIWPWGPDYCPLIGHNPGVLLVCLLDITPWDDFYMWWV
jgi:hypothetical protein